MMPVSVQSLRTKITLVVVLSSAVGLGTFTAAVVGKTARDYSGMLDHEILTMADVIGQNSAAALDFNDRRSAYKVLQALRSNPAVLAGCLYDIHGNLFSEFRRGPDSPPCAIREDKKTDGVALSQLYSRPIVRDGEQVGAIGLLANRTDLRNRIRRSFAFAVLLAFLSLGVGSLAGRILQKAVSRPLFDLMSAMQTVTSQGTFEANVAMRGPQEIVQLASSFNAMLAELRRRGDIAKSAETRLQELARTDALTGLPNRRQFSECLRRERIRMDRERTLLGLLYIDLDGFKQVNDSLGHSFGDLLLRAVVERIKIRLRQSDTLARLGGDEFGVILPNLSTERDAGRIAQSLIAALSAPFDLEGNRCGIGASIGVLTHRGNIVSDDKLLSHADAAMYAAKRQGKNRVVTYSEESDAVSHQGR
jgi:diguanylate cyclase (GGDEF)-like protein